MASDDGVPVRKAKPKAKVKAKAKRKKALRREKRKRRAAAAAAVPAAAPAAAAAAAATAEEEDEEEGGSVSAVARDIEALTVKAGGRKSKVRRALNVDVTGVPEDPAELVAAHQPIAPPKRLLLASPFDLDDWTEKFASDAHTMPPEVKRKNMAQALRETISQCVGDDDDPPAAAAAASASGGGADQRYITIEQFFSGEIDVPLVGHAKDMRSMMKRLKRDIVRREALSAVAVAEAETAAARKKADLIRAKKKDARQARPAGKRHGKSASGEKRTAASLESEAAIAAAEEETRPDSTLFSGATSKNMMVAPLEEVSRAYCADFYREARGIEYGERSCRRGKACVFALMSARPPDAAAPDTSEEGFVCREFLLPSELDEWSETGGMPETPHLCLGCDHMVTTFTHYLNQQRGVTPAEMIQTHANIVDDVSEYGAEHCIFPNPDIKKWTGIVRPIRKWDPNSFVSVPVEVKAESGRTWVLQGAHEILVDFRLSPSSYDVERAKRVHRNFLMAKCAAGASAGNYDKLPYDPRSAWVSGIPGAEMLGVRPCRPLRPLDWIQAEMDVNPPHPGFGFGPGVEMVPRTLLAKAFPDASPYVFCDFDTTLEEMRRRPHVFAMALFPHIRFAREVYSFERSVLDAVLGDVSCTSLEGMWPTLATRPTYRIVMTIIFRLMHAHKLLAYAASCRKYDYWLHLFIDTHLDLCTGMHLAGRFDDASVTNPDENPNSVCLSILTENYPHDTRVAHAGDLPDLTPSIQFASVWFEVQPRSKKKKKSAKKTPVGSAAAAAGSTAATTAARAQSRRNAKARVESVAEALKHIVACKTQPHKCQVRNFPTIAHRYATQFPQIMALFRSIITVSLLGNYPHARLYPEFSARMHIAYSLRQTVTTDRQLFLWMKENEQMSYAVVKEYYRHLVSLDPSFEAVLEGSMYWETVRDYACVAMDRARAIVGVAGSSGSDPLNGRYFSTQERNMAGHGPTNDDNPVFSGTAADPDASLHKHFMRTIDIDMQTQHESLELPFITKLRKGCFSEVFVQETTRFFSRTVLEDNVPRPQNSMLALAKHLGRDLTEKVAKRMRFVIEKRVSRAATREPVETCWLSYFGMSKEGILALRALYYDYETKDIADNSISTRVDSLFKHSAYDFHVAALFFQMVAEWRSAASFQLPGCYIARQTAALRTKLFVPPYEPLPDDAGTFYMCLSCKRWLSGVVDIDDVATRVNMYSTGMACALYSHDTDTIYCGHKKVQNASRKNVDDGVYPNLDEDLPDVREARKVRLYLSSTVCCATPAVAVNMVGRCQRLGKRLWALCEICGSITQWDGTRFGPSGFTCGFHDPNAPKPRSKQQIEKQRLRKIRTAMPPKARCDYCRVTLRPGEDYGQITVVNDCDDKVLDIDGYTDANHRKATFAFEPYVLCDTDAGALEASMCKHSHDGEQHSAVRRSYLERFIHRMRVRKFGEAENMRTRHA